MVSSFRICYKLKKIFYGSQVIALQSDLGLKYVILNSSEIGYVSKKLRARKMNVALKKQGSEREAKNECGFKKTGKRARFQETKIIMILRCVALKKAGCIAKKQRIYFFCPFSCFFGSKTAWMFGKTPPLAIVTPERSLFNSSSLRTAN